jgi:gliding motility-associated-like protein
VFSKCNYVDSIKVNYNRDLDNLRVTATPQRIEYGKTSQLQATATNIISYLWTPKETLSNQYIPSPIASPKVTTTYYVTVKDPLGCRSSDSVIVDLFFEDCKDPEVYLPTGFTPNKDGKNDALYLRGDNIEKMQLQIYDRWGQMVFESKNQKKGWDGTFNGIELEPTVYAYYLWVQCIGGATYSKSGNITLIK